MGLKPRNSLPRMTPNVPHFGQPTNSMNPFGGSKQKIGSSIPTPSRHHIGTSNNNEPVTPVKKIEMLKNSNFNLIELMR